MEEEPNADGKQEKQRCKAIDITRRKEELWASESVSAKSVHIQRESGRSSVVAMRSSSWRSPRVKHGGNWQERLNLESRSLFFSPRATSQLVTWHF